MGDVKHAYHTTKIVLKKSARGVDGTDLKDRIGMPGTGPRGPREPG